MSEAEIKLDRYAKFRKLGMFQEYVVKGGDWRGAAAERSAVSACTCMVPRVLSSTTVEPALALPF